MCNELLIRFALGFPVIDEIVGRIGYVPETQVCRSDGSVIRSERHAVDTKYFIGRG